MKSNAMKYAMRCLTMVAGLLLDVSCFAQSSVDTLGSYFLDETQRTLHSTLYGVGTSNVLDTYLSPYNYTGIDVRLMRETMRPTHLAHGHIHYQTFIDLDGGYLRNRTQNVHEWVAGVRYANAWMYQFVSMESGAATGGMPSYMMPGAFNLYAGLQPSAYLGGIYNTRNGNNPAQAKFDIMVNATAMAEYNLRLFHHVFPVRYQLTIPLLGAAFSMNYGQSYYECFCLGDYDHNVVFANIINMPSMRHLLTLDIPIRRNFLRVGWSGEFNQAKFNGLRYHSFSNNFMIGFTKYFYRK